MMVGISDVNENSLDSDLTPRSLASNQGLHRLSMSFYGTLGINGLTHLCLACSE